MNIDPESRSVQGLTMFLHFVALNVLFILLCLPVVTVGAATSALLEVMIKYSDDERGRPLEDFLPAFKRNFRPATAVYLALLVPFVLLTFAAVFWFAQETTLSTILSLVALLVAAYLVAAFTHGMALVARYRNTFRQTLRNALLLPAAEPVRTIGLLLIPATVASITLIFPPFGLIVLSIGFAMMAYASAFLYRSIFSRHA
ncbi:YesL family protein [Demequina lignilytica]|uniref:YesL family protein n=1 Tax=Demequina lignilytica TaxID=3051663 RepID=A0AB35MJE2_9MICO|nr:YesL family protein [Demequina sp. SYSU T0a273]MDN4483904.1 YesL family protein [Demequina sp. SYSU T0a273]